VLQSSMYRVAGSPMVVLSAAITTGMESSNKYRETFEPLRTIVFMVYPLMISLVEDTAVPAKTDGVPGVNPRVPFGCTK